MREEYHWRLRSRLNFDFVNRLGHWQFDTWHFPPAGSRLRAKHRPQRFRVFCVRYGVADLRLEKGMAGGSLGRNTRKGGILMDEKLLQWLTKKHGSRKGWR